MKGEIIMVTFAGFIDAGYLRAQGAEVLRWHRPSVRLSAKGIVEWYEKLGDRNEGAFGHGNGDFLRAYWYDGAFDPQHERFETQREYFNAVKQTPGIQLRLGRITERKPKHQKPIISALKNTAKSLGMQPDVLLAEFENQWEFKSERRQKGVDTLIALDMVRFASARIFDTAVLISGDQDLAGAVEAVQDLGCRVVIASPGTHSIARDLSSLADDITLITEPELEKMLWRQRQVEQMGQPRGSSTPKSAPG